MDAGGRVQGCRIDMGEWNEKRVLASAIGNQACRRTWTDAIALSLGAVNQAMQLTPQDRNINVISVPDLQGRVVTSLLFDSMPKQASRFVSFDDVSHHLQRDQSFYTRFTAWHWPDVGGRRCRGDAEGDRLDQDLFGSRCGPLTEQGCSDEIPTSGGACARLVGHAACINSFGSYDPWAEG